MLESGITNFIMFFVILGMCLIFIITWILKAESKVNICKQEIKKLRDRCASFDRERFMLTERLESSMTASSITKNDADDAQKISQGKDAANSALLLQALEQNSELEKEKKRLQSELDEAKKSIEEVYNAIAAQG